MKERVTPMRATHRDYPSPLPPCPVRKEPASYPPVAGDPGVLSVTALDTSPKEGRGVPPWGPSSANVSIGWRCGEGRVVSAGGTQPSHEGDLVHEHRPSGQY